MEESPNIKWAGNNVTSTQEGVRSVPLGFPAQNYQRRAAPTVDNSMENLLKTFMSDAKATFETHGTAIKNLENQVGHIADALTQRPSGVFPSTTKASTSYAVGKEHVKAISLRSEKDLIRPSITSCDGTVEKKKKIKKMKMKKFF